MKHSAAPPAAPDPGPLARLDAAIAAARARLDRLIDARQVLLELDGPPPAAAPATVAPRRLAAAAVPPAANGDHAADHNRRKSENARAANRLAIARVLLADGPQQANTLFRLFPGRGAGWIRRTCGEGSDWFVRVGERPGGVDTRPWGLTPRGREEAAALIAAEKRPAASAEPPAAPRSRPRDPHPAPEPPADRGREAPDPHADPRPNPDLDAEFAADLFLAELAAGKPTPRPGLNGTGRGHRPPATANGRH